MTDRAKIAAMAMQGIVSNPTTIGDVYQPVVLERAAASLAVRFADALLADSLILNRALELAATTPDGNISHDRIAGWIETARKEQAC